jgi:signal transduction histidine kinase
LVLALDIDSIERTEHRLGWVVTGSALAMVLVLAGVAAWGVGRLTQPLRDLAATIAKLQPQRASEVVTLAPGATVELVVIADAMNDYLRRNDRFVEREHAFIDNASHELRTPIAVIAGAAEVALDNGSLPGAVALQLTRIRHAARDMEQLITLLLVLAKDPARLADISEHVALDELLPRIVDDHRHLCRNKLLTVRIEDLPACTLNAPAHIVRAALGNLLRNAIENSDRGEIVLSLDAEGKVSIQDPGRGMSAEEVSEIYSRLARGGARNDAGIGLALIGRLCEHLHWVLNIQSEVGLGSRVTLDFSASKAASIS